MSARASIIVMFISLVVIGTCAISTTRAAEPLPAPVIKDIALRDGGVLEGQIVDQQNVGRQGVQVTIRYQDHDLATTTTDANGRYAFQGLRGGVHQVVTAEGSEVFRLWAPRTAPPSAQDLAIVRLNRMTTSCVIKRAAFWQAQS